MRETLLKNVTSRLTAVLIFTIALIGSAAATIAQTADSPLPPDKSAGSVNGIKLRLVDEARSPFSNELGADPEPFAVAGTVTIRKGATVPGACDVTGTNSSPLFWKTSGTNPGLYTCLLGVYSFQTNTFGSGLTQKTMLYASATPAAITSTAAPTDGQLLIGDTSDIPALGTLTGTSNETLITNAAHSITIGLSATVQHKAGANFLLTDPSDTTKKFSFDLSGITTGTTRTWIMPDSADTFVGLAATQTLTNKNLTMGGGSTNHLADSADATKTATFGLTNITTGTNRAVNIPDAASTTVQALVAIDSQVVSGLNGNTGALSGAIVDTRLVTNPSVDMNTATPLILYTSPSGRSTIITKVVISACSTSLTTASISFGWTSAAFADVIANATHTELTGNTLYTVLIPKVGATIGTSTGTFKVLNNTLQGGAATCKMDVFGFTF